MRDHRDAGRDGKELSFQGAEFVEGESKELSWQGENGMNMHEEELQRSIEKGLVPKGDELDVRIYQDLFKSLSKPPVINIPANFADRVLAKVIERKVQRSSRDFVWLGVGVFLLVSVAVIGFAYSGLKIEISNLKQLAGIGGLVLFAIAFCGFLNIIDKKAVAGKLESRW